MPLTVDWRRLDPPLTDHEQETAAFNIGVALLLIGVPEIKDDRDVHEVVARLAFYERLYGPYLTRSDGTSVNTTTFWSRWIGVRINDAPKPRATFIKQFTKQVFERLDRIVPTNGKDDGC